MTEPQTAGNQPLSVPMDLHVSFQCRVLADRRNQNTVLIPRLVGTSIADIAFMQLSGPRALYTKLKLHPAGNRICTSQVKWELQGLPANTYLTYWVFHSEENLFSSISVEIGETSSRREHDAGEGEGKQSLCPSSLLLPFPLTLQHFPNLKSFLLDTLPQFWQRCSLPFSRPLLPTAKKYRGPTEPWS